MGTIGIDLGTTNSAVAIWEDGAPRLIPNVHGSVLTPSVVGLDDSGEVIVGEAGRERLRTNPECTVAAFKRAMGTAKTFRLGDHTFHPEELSAFVLRSLKADIELELGHPVEEAVITVPAYFNEVQRQSTRQAAELAGLRATRLLNEPTAAALAHGLGVDEEGIFVVLDLGGGTFDVSVVECFEGIMEVRASAGDNALGGEDFTELLIGHLIEGIDDLDDEARAEIARSERPRLYAAAERAKLALSADVSTAVPLELASGSHRVEIRREAFERLAEPLLARIAGPVKTALRDSKLRATDVDALVLVGGATRMPMVGRLCSTLIGRFPEHGHDPDRVVALGAAVQAALKDRERALDEVVLTDVCPHTLGVEVLRTRADGSYRENTFAPIIERNTTIPASREERFYAVHPGQESIRLVVYQGESIDTRDNVKLGELEIGIPRNTETSEAVDVRFSYDINGLLEVDATVASNGKSANALIEGRGANLGPEEIARSRERLAKLKIHPREDQANLALIHRGKRLYEQLLRQDREAVATALHAFQGALETQDPTTIERAVREFGEFLDRFEG